MFGNSKPDYNPVALGEYSDDESDVETPSSFHGRQNGNSNSNNGIGGRNSNDFDKLRQQQQIMMKKQDEGLEMLGQHVEQLGQMSLQIQEEINSQNNILDEMDNDLDQATQQLDFVTKKTKEFIQASGGTQNFIIILSLIITAIVLFLLILYT